MTTEQKLREALRIAVNYIDMDALYTFAGGDHDTIKEALATTEPTSKQPLQVEPAVNQQLTTEPVADLSDDMGSLADYFGDMAQQKADLDASRGVSMPVSYYASTVVAAALAWQARAAMAKGVKG